MTDNETKTSSGEDNQDTGLSPDTKLSASEEINPANDDREIDIGESGQYAPGGRYNQLNVNAPRRLDLDEQVDSALKNEDK